MPAREPVAAVDSRSGAEGTWIAVSGRLDRRTVPDIRLALHDLIDTGHGDIHVDLADCVVGDSTALGLLIECLRRSRRADRPFHVVAADGRTQRLLRRARLARLIRLLEPCAAGHPTEGVVTASDVVAQAGGVGTLTA